MTKITGWPEGMLQDDSRPLSKALASKPVNARDCEHGHLARSCELCSFEAEIDDLRKALRQEQDDNASLAALYGAMKAERDALRAKLSETHVRCAT